MAAPYALAVDGSDNLYFSEMRSHNIRKVTSAGVVSTYAGQVGGKCVQGRYGLVCDIQDGPAAQARFNQPNGIVADAAGNVYMADRDNHTIRKITPSGVVTTLAGVAGERGAADGVGSAARFNQPTGLGIDQAGNLFVTDTGNHTVRRIIPDGSRARQWRGAAWSTDAASAAKLTCCSSTRNVSPNSLSFASRSWSANSLCLIIGMS